MAVLKPRYMIDKSALARMPEESVRERLAPIVEGGEAATCSIIELEVLYSARGYDEHEETRQRRSLAYYRVPMTEGIFDRAIQIQGDLARKGRHRVPIPDLLVAATAESAELSILHYDAHFDQIAEVTEQAVEWVVPRGSF